MTSARFFLALKWITLLFFLFVFAHKTATFIDPDLGWHLRAGEIVTQTGTAPMIDKWNYVITQTPWIDHEWLMDLTLFTLLTKGLWTLVIVIFFAAAFIPLAIWIFRTKTAIELLFVATAGSTLWTMIGVRPQVFSFLLFFILYEFLFSKERALPRSMSYLSLPLFFAFWANIHAGFVAGLALWGLVILVKTYEKINAKRLTTSDILNIESASFALSIGATLLTPYHLNLWKEIFASTTSPLISYIAEWQSPLSSLDIPLIIFLSATGAFILALRKTLPLDKLVLGIFFFVSYVQHARMAPFFFIISLPIIAHVILLLEPGMRKLLLSVQKKWITLITFIPALLITALLAYDSTSTMLRDPYQPPREAVTALQSVPHEPCNIFNDYGFGGWMIFDDPQRPLFIDGRGPHWISSSNVSPFAEYVGLIKTPETWKNVFLKYNICVAILPNTANMEHPNDSPDTATPWKKMFTKIANLFYPNEGHTPLLSVLRNDGWCTVYSDEKAVIAVAPGSQLCDNKK